MAAGEGSEADQGSRVAGSLSTHHKWRHGSQSKNHACHTRGSSPMPNTLLVPSMGSAWQEAQPCWSHTVLSAVPHCIQHRNSVPSSVCTHTSVITITGSDSSPGTADLPCGTQSTKILVYSATPWQFLQSSSRCLPSTWHTQLSPPPPHPQISKPDLPWVCPYELSPPS